MEKQIHSVREAAKKLSVSYVWLDKKIRKNKVASIWFGGRRMITEEEIQRLIKEGVSK